MRERKGSLPNNDGFWFGETYKEVTTEDLRSLRRRAISYVLGFDPPHGKIEEIEEHIVRFMIQIGAAHELEELGELFQSGTHHKGTLKKSAVRFDMGPKYGEWREDYHRGGRHAFILYDKEESTAVIGRLNMTGITVISKAKDLATRQSNK